MQIRGYKVALGVAVSALVLALVLRRLDAELLLATICEARPGWLGVAAALYTLSLLARGRQLAAVLATTPRVATTSVGVQLLLTRVTPMRVGELSLPLLLRRQGRVGLTRALVAVFYVRLLEVSTIAGLLLMALLLEPASTSVRSSTACGFALLLALVACFQRVSGGVGRLCARAAAWLGGARSAAARSLERVASAAAAAVEPGPSNRGLAFALSVAIVGLETLLFGALLRALSRGVAWGTLVRGSCVTVLGAALPLPTIGTIGTLEASWAFSFTWAGLDPEVALATGVAAQVITLLLAALHAVVCWALLTRGGDHG